MLSSVPMQTVMPRLLVIDDDGAIRDLCGKILGRSGYDLVVVETAEEGLERCAEVAFDLVVTDLTLPGMDGIRFAEVLRASHPQVRVLIFSGHFTDAKETATRQASATPGLFFLAKPFRPKELLAAVAAALDAVPPIKTVF
ncbi:MAG: response regulator [Magnetococcus sp. THC-1_WYH]